MLALLLAAAAANVDIQSQTMTLDAAAHRAHFGGGVTAVRGDLTLQCPAVVAAYAAGGHVTTATCDGPVTARQGARTMTARQGTFDNGSSRLTLEGDPTFVEGERRLTGDTLVWNVQEEEGELTPARAQLPARDENGVHGPVNITSSVLHYASVPRRAIFVGDVVITRGGLTLRTDRLVAVHGEDGQLTEAYSDGPVQVDQGERHASAARARFTGGAQQLVLEGNPVLTERDSTMTGDRVVFLLASDRVEVEHPRAIFPLRKAAVP
jgi:lipopolysaccharide transport protein LptA